MNFKLLCYCVQVLCIPVQYVRGMWNMLIYVHTYCTVYKQIISIPPKNTTRKSFGYTIYSCIFTLLFKIEKHFFLIFFLIKFIFSILSRYYFLRICILQQLLTKFTNRSWYVRTDPHVKLKNWSISGPVCVSAVCKEGVRRGAGVYLSMWVWGVKFTLCTHQPTLKLGTSNKTRVSRFSHRLSQLAPLSELTQLFHHA